MKMTIGASLRLTFSVKTQNINETAELFVRGEFGGSSPVILARKPLAQGCADWTTYTVDFVPTTWGWPDGTKLDSVLTVSFGNADIRNGCTGYGTVLLDNMAIAPR